MSVTIDSTATVTSTEARMSLKGLWQAVYARLVRVYTGLSQAFWAVVARFPKVAMFLTFAGAFFATWFAATGEVGRAGQVQAMNMAVAGAMAIVELFAALWLGWGWYSLVSALLVGAYYAVTMTVMSWLFLAIFVLFMDWQQIVEHTVLRAAFSML